MRANPEKRAQGPGEDSETAASPEYKLLEYVRSYDDGPAGRRAHVVREPLQILSLRARDEAGDDLEQLGSQTVEFHIFFMIFHKFQMQFHNFS